MDPYDNRRITLDPGRTALALRGLHDRNGQYPFIERHARWRDFSLVLRRLLATWFTNQRDAIGQAATIVSARHARSTE
jgi:hypothetical protein